MTIKFISFNKEWVTTMKQLFDKEPLIIVDSCDIKDIPVENSCFVSPANSLGFMDGGIDLVLSRTIFPGIEPQVRERIRQLGIMSSLDRPYLPIGSAISVSHGANSHLIVAPTMFLPHDVRGTENAYYSFYAALKMWDKQIGRAHV